MNIFSAFSIVCGRLERIEVPVCARFCDYMFNHFHCWGAYLCRMHLVGVGCTVLERRFSCCSYPTSRLRHVALFRSAPRV